jgi:uncharacterized membrane protein YbhN (UPF0104 family)
MFAMKKLLTHGNLGPMKRKLQLRLILRVLFSIGISLLLLWILFSMIRKHPGEFVPRDMSSIAGRLPMWAVPLYIVCALLQTWFRAWRYRLLLRTGIGDGEAIPKAPLFFLTLSRNMFVDMLPSRIGEASYLILLKRVLGTRLAHGLSSLSVSFAFDLVALTALVFIIGGTGLVLGQPSKPLLVLLLLLLVIVGIGLALLFFGFGRVVHFTEIFLSGLRKYSFIQSLIRTLSETWTSIQHIRNEDVLIKTFFLSLCVRFFKYSGLFFLLSAILATAFPSIATRQFDGILTTLIAGEAAASLPIPTFMSFGSYELGATWVLNAAGYALSDAALAVFLLHLLSQVIDYSLGFCGTLYCIFTTRADS